MRRRNRFGNGIVWNLRDDCRGKGELYVLLITFIVIRRLCETWRTDAYCRSGRCAVFSCRCDGWHVCAKYLYGNTGVGVDSQDDKKEDGCSSDDRRSAEIYQRFFGCGCRYHYRTCRGVYASGSDGERY